MSVNVGDKAPSFTLFSEAKEAINLSDYQGKSVVLLFFPLAFTGTCTEELCSMRDQMNEYNDLNAQVLAVSVDTVFTLEKYKQAEGFNFPLLSDFNKEVSRQYGSLYEEFVFGMRGVSKRSAFVIDAEGIVRYTEVLEKPTDLPNFAEVKATLATHA